MGEKIQHCAHYTNISVKKCSIKNRKEILYTRKHISPLNVLIEVQVLKENCVYIDFTINKGIVNLLK